MKAAEQVQIIRQALLLREKNQYTQSSLRLLVNQGYSDCSSFVWWLYLSTLKLDIGMDTPEQILSLKGLDVDFGESEIPDTARLNPGDLLFLRATTYPGPSPSAMLKCTSARENSSAITTTVFPARPSRNSTPSARNAAMPDALILKPAALYFNNFSGQSK